MRSPCPNYERCGSCGWSHIPYEAQLKQKLSDINGSFRLKDLTLECQEILPSPITEHYRNRMDFVIDFEGKVGLREKGKWWRVIDNHTCFLADRRIEELFSITKKWVKDCGLSFHDRKTHLGFLRYAIIRATTLGESMLTILTSAPSDPAEKGLALKALEVLVQQSAATTLIWAINHTETDVSIGGELQTVSGEGSICEIVAGTKYRISPNAFFQTNSRAAGLLLNTVLSFTGQARGRKILDLYCGSGFFSIPLAKCGAQVLAVEVVAQAIYDARVNAQLNGAEVDFRCEQAEKFNWKEESPQAIILDPPRSGMHNDSLKAILEVLPPQIVYVSCNYKNFAREMVDLQKFYKVERMVALDMFPHTPHVELVSKLSRF